MEYISLALVIIAAMAYTLINRWMDEKSSLNTKASEEALSTAVEERLKKFDARINDTWAVTSSVKLELEAIRLMMGIKGNK